MRAEAVVVVREAWRADPLAWIHRVEARAIARELRASLKTYPFSGRVLLRLSDPVMRRAVKEIQAPYCGPGSAALERCYDKYEAHRLVTAAGIDAPRTFLASDAGELQAPFVLKPRRGSDSIGVRVVRSVSAATRDAHHVVQELVLGEEITIAVFRDQVGAPLRILLPPGAPYSFMRKYLFRPRRSVVEERALSERIRESAARAAQCLGVDWAARVDLIAETGTGTLRFLECDAAPLVGAASAFAASFSAAAVDRATQLGWLMDKDGVRPPVHHCHEKKAH